MLSKEQAKERIKQLINDFKEGEVVWNNKPEEDIKFQFIEPLFEALGWNRKDISKEQRVLKGRADYILKNGNQEVLVIEAKKTNVFLAEEEGRQAVSYAYHRKIKFAVLTNFKDLRVYHALSNIKEIDRNLLKKEGTYFKLNYSEFLDKFDLLWLLSKESFENGEINKLLSTKDEKINKPIDATILEDLLYIRELLSKELKSKKNYLEKETIDEVIQILIDRLIFIRSVEDRGLEPMNYLRSLESDVAQQRVKLQLFPYLIEKFEEFNKKYDSKLFEKGLLEKEGTFSDDILRKVILTLYFGSENNQERYLFDQIPGDLFGSIYEQYLGTILSGTEKRVKLEGGTGKRKKMGIYYTPSYIVDYIVRNTVGEYIKDKSIDEILAVRILDPACGSGSFITRAFVEVCNVIEDKLNKGEEGSKILFKKTKEKIWKLSLGQKIEILRNCIYGVDLDEKAVELARLNLLLKLLDEESQETRKLLLPHLENNIKCGNSLIDDSNVSDRAFNWNAQFQDVFRNGGFDVVVGNPPWSSKIPSTVNKFLAEKFSMSQKNMNIFAIFVIHSLKLLRKKGVFGLLIPKVIIKNDSYTSVRKEIIENYSLFKIMDFGQFPGVVSDAICLLIENKKGFQPINIQFFEESKLIKENKIEKDIFSKNDSFVFSLSTDDKIQGLLDKIAQNSKKLSELFKIKRGIELGQKSLVVQCNKCGFYNEANTKYYGQNDKKCKKCGDKLIINDKSVKMISSDREEKDYSSEAIAGNQLQRYSISGKYYILPKLKGIDYKEIAFEGPKILIKRINTKIEGTFTKSKLFAFNTIYSIYGNKSENNYLYSLAILNSKLIKFYYEFLYNVGMNLTTQVTIDFLSKIPIHLPTKPQEKKIIDLVNQMLEFQKKYHVEGISGNEKERLGQQIKNTDYEIDEEVYKLYEITEDEKKIIEESLK